MVCLLADYSDRLAGEPPLASRSKMRPRTSLTYPLDPCSDKNSKSSNNNDSKSININNSKSDNKNKNDIDNHNSGSSGSDGPSTLLVLHLTEVSKRNCFRPILNPSPFPCICNVIYSLHPALTSSSLDTASPVATRGIGSPLGGARMALQTAANPARQPPGAKACCLFVRQGAKTTELQWIMQETLERLPQSTISHQ